jgi:Asp-tRNA(Asn)/Glu-tRNA(Gln) amidotransferase C subunit
MGTNQSKRIHRVVVRMETRHYNINDLLKYLKERHEVKKQANETAIARLQKRESMTKEEIGRVITYLQDMTAFDTEESEATIKNLKELRAQLDADTMDALELLYG